MAELEASKLAQKKCQPCEGDTKPLSIKEAKELLVQLSGWNLSNDSKCLWREYVMKDFRAAVELIQRIAEVAESEDHHPDLYLTSYRKLRIELATHSIGGLSENDFILAAKIDRLPKVLKK